MGSCQNISTLSCVVLKDACVVVGYTSFDTISSGKNKSLSMIESLWDLLELYLVVEEA